MPPSDRNRPRLLLFGSTGQLGKELLRTFASTMDVEAPTRAELDMSRPDAVLQEIKAFQPKWVINASAYTAVDRAEGDSTDAQLINSDSVRAIGEAAAEIGAAVFHYSTDYVFDGNKNTPYVETDPPNPINAYGRTKLGGEVALEHSGAAYILFRVSWLYGARGANFLRTILRRAHLSATSAMPVRIVNDQHGTPTWTRDVAETTRKVVERITAEARAADISPAEAMRPYNGLYHLTGRGETTWYGFAAEALQQLHIMMPDAKFSRVVPIPTDEYPTPARRPKSSRLDCSKLERTFGIRLPDWQDSLTSVLAEIVSEGVKGLQ